MRGDFQKIVGSPWKGGIVRLEVDKSFYDSFLFLFLSKLKQWSMSAKKKFELGVKRAKKIFFFAKTLIGSVILLTVYDFRYDFFVKEDTKPGKKGLIFLLLLPQPKSYFS